METPTPEPNSRTAENKSNPTQDLIRRIAAERMMAPPVTRKRILVAGRIQRSRVTTHPSLGAVTFQRTRMEERTEKTAELLMDLPPDLVLTRVEENKVLVLRRTRSREIPESPAEAEPV